MFDYKEINTEFPIPTKENKNSLLFIEFHGFHHFFTKANKEFFGVTPEQ